MGPIRHLGGHRLVVEEPPAPDGVDKVRIAAVVRGVEAGGGNDCF